MPLKPRYSCTEALILCIILNLAKTGQFGDASILTEFFEDNKTAKFGLYLPEIVSCIGMSLVT